MKIEEGSLFAVTRGHLQGDPGLFYSGAAPTYDRTHEGRIYRAAAVCGPLVVADIVVVREYDSKKEGDRISINTTELETLPVTEAYVEAMRTTIPQVEETT